MTNITMYVTSECNAHDRPTYLKPVPFFWYRFLVRIS